MRRTLRRAAKRLLADERGGEAIEYTLVAGLIVIAATAALSSVGGKVLALWNSINGNIAGAAGTSVVNPTGGSSQDSSHQDQEHGDDGGHGDDRGHGDGGDHSDGHDHGDGGEGDRGDDGHGD